MNHGFYRSAGRDGRAGWNQVDFVYVSGDAYVDHPSFGHAIITRLLEAHGFRVGIIAQPDWKDKEVLQNLESRGLDLWCRREIWIPWSTIILYQRKDGSRILIHRAE